VCVCVRVCVCVCAFVRAFVRACVWRCSGLESEVKDSLSPVRWIG
jgi:hypothetical protein